MRMQTKCQSRETILKKVKLRNKLLKITFNLAIFSRLAELETNRFRQTESKKFGKKSKIPNSFSRFYRTF